MLLSYFMSSDFHSLGMRRVPSASESPRSTHGPQGVRASRGPPHSPPFPLTGYQPPNGYGPGAGLGEEALLSFPFPPRFPIPCIRQPRLSLTQPPLPQALVVASGPRKSVSPLRPHVGHESRPLTASMACLCVCLCPYLLGSRVLSAGPHGWPEPVRWVLSQVRVD